jgi:hypothetical protein
MSRHTVERETPSARPACSTVIISVMPLQYHECLIVPIVSQQAGMLVSSGFHHGVAKRWWSCLLGLNPSCVRKSDTCRAIDCDTLPIPNFACSPIQVF